METFEMQAKQRTADGTRKARGVRRNEMIPGIVYGHGMKALTVEVPERAFYKALHTKAGSNVLITLRVEGVQLKESTCRIKDIQHNPVTDKIDHVDFMVISLTENITVKVPVVLLHVEDAPGIKEGGSLDLVHREIEIECLPTQIPEKIEINIKEMKINDAVHVKELALAEGLKCLLSQDDVVVAIHPPREEEVKAAEEGEAAAPEVIEKGKKEKEGEEAAAPAAAKPAAAPAKEAK
ncbi:MAG TPA: 50S ribosomal protein L25/general stress protein Ctc [Candidatus Omnitrophota bacterium]|nr:50S ribosomal protein L25/general stress protein Ctc [Candidatus Omnitrophota bacterium]HPS37116.1 50S ribosomal protein L25/general stress protein Ctc [Candidatus Omnitrophota bacterium]